MTKQKNFTKGRYGESLALQYLKSLGYQFIQSNFHTRYGEIDLIMIDKNKLIFIEVKYKSLNSPGTPEEMISPKKINQILRTAQSFLTKNPDLTKDYSSYRLDAICIVGNDIKHYQNISS